MRCVAVLCLVALLQVSVNCEKIISVGNGGRKGDWGVMKVCYRGTRATGFRLKVEPDHGWFIDDTALNGITLYCTRNNSNNVHKAITSSVGDSGTWKRNFFCNSGFLMWFCLKSMAYRLDDMGVTNIRFWCSNFDELEGDGLDDGKFGPCSDRCPLGICGIKTKVEANRGPLKDDSSLNDVEFLCCSEDSFPSDEEKENV